MIRKIGNQKKIKFYDNKIIIKIAPEGRISSNLLKRKQSSRKTSIMYRWFKSHDWPP